MPIVQATREGLISKRTASGAIVDLVLPFVALPSVAALHQWIAISNPANGRGCTAIVLDVGPWNTQDAAYVFGSARPQAESGSDRSGRQTNGAGIDLSEYVWRALKLTDNALVEWEFCEPAFVERGEQLDGSAVAARLARFFPQKHGRRQSDRRPRAGPAKS